MTRPFHLSLTLGWRGRANTAFDVRMGGTATALLRTEGDDLATASQIVAALLMLARPAGLTPARAAAIAYLAERESLSTYGHPILDTEFAAVATGPVNALVHTLAHGTAQVRPWAKLIVREDGLLRLRPGLHPDLEMLSAASLDAIQTAWALVRPLGDDDLVALCRDLPEWHADMGLPHTIPLERIMEGIGLGDVGSRMRHIEAHRGFGRLLARHGDNDYGRA